MAVIAAKDRVKTLKATRALSELLPWVAPLTPGIVLCKDGGLLAGWSFHGLDSEGRGAAEQAGDSRHLERAINGFVGNRIKTWWTVRRDRSSGWAGGDFSDPVTRRVDASARAAWNKKSHYVAHRAFWIMVSPPTPAETLVARIAQEGASGLLSGIGPWLLNVLAGQAAFENDARRLMDRVSEAESLFERVGSLFPAAGFNRLIEERLLGWLNALASPSEPYHPLRTRSALQALDETLGECTLDQNASAMYFAGPTRTVHAAALTIKTVPDAWPESIGPGVFDRILDIDCECVFSLATRYLDTEAARGAVKERRRHLLNWRKGLGGYVKEGLMKVETDQVDSDKDVQAKEADAALLDLSNSPSAGHAFPVLVLRAESAEKLERSVSDASRLFHVAEFAVLRERMHQISAWAGTLPGQWAEPVRWSYLSGAAIADMAPIRGPARGSSIARHLSKMSGSRQPALCTFATRSMEPYWLEPHLGDVGHGIILGPTGMGKSVLGGWMCLRWTQYSRSRVFVFDKDRSLRKMILLAGGHYLGDSGKMRINPFAGLEGDDDWRWATDFVVQLLSPDDGELEPVDVNEIATACRRIQSLEPGDRRLRSLKALLPARLGDRLAQWIGDGRYAGYFDHETDGMTLGAFVGIAMDEVLRFPRAARAFMDLAFHRIGKQLDGAPVYIHIEEGWFALDDPAFARKLDDWLRTLRKLNGVLILSTQSLKEIAESRTFTGFASAPNRFLLPNPDIASFESIYRDGLRLTREQMKIIGEARPKGETVLVRDGRTRVLRVDIPAEGIALLRADAEADEVFERWMNSGHPEWRMRYVDEMVERQTRRD
ncbi:hypothetical protein BI364_06985 [Acidihalobacter yilgarnensis]|uniref:CagE TrbE VirB component of type IV transporter system central domain-containing protein n=1 Tax=Acidihalobacter yilgarnensis TaxID=2819280 RepID=A0A1D8IMN6_9GAMM|nr:hypothetical protein BI364_06985 [Acidihalobacter yilgarnensis]